MIRPLEHLACTYSTRQALRIIEERADVLVIAPSTRRSFYLARELVAHRACRVTTVPIPEQRTLGIGRSLRTPAQIVAEVAGHSALPGPVISFPDALVGEGEAFSAVPFLGAERAFSILEVLLVMRHRPRVFAFRSLPAGAFRLVPVDYQGLVTGKDAVALVPLMQRLLGELERELTAPPHDWLGERCLALKRPEVFERRVREELREVESLLRLAVIASSSQPDSLEALAPALEGVTRELRGGARHRPTLH